MASGSIVVIDYPGRRDEARIASLELEGCGWDVRYLLTAPLGRELTSRDYALGLARRHELTDPAASASITAVLAFCAAAPIAQDLLAALGSRSRPVPLLLFDGEPSPPQNIARDFRAAAAQLAATPRDAAAIGVAPETFTSACLTERPAYCVEHWRYCLTALARRALEADGAGEDEAEEDAAAVVEHYLDWFVYLVAAHNTTWPAWPGHVYHIASRAHGYTADWPGSAATTVTRVNADRNDLLRFPETRERVLSFLASLKKGAARAVN